MTGPSRPARAAGGPAGTGAPPAAGAGAGRRLEVRLGPLTLKNPVVTAAGTSGYGREAAAFYPLDRLGAVTVKGLSLEPWPGNPPPRAVETPAGMLNAIGLQNPGVDHFLARDLPWLRRFEVPVIANVVGKTVDEYVEVARRLDAAGVDALELNLSCPNVKAGGLEFGRDPQVAASLVRAVRRVTRRPLLVKLSPEGGRLLEVAAAVMEAGAGGLSLINTLRGAAVDVDAERPVLATVGGGLSGPAIRPVAVYWIWEVYRHLRAPILGMGGVVLGRDAAELMLAGATAVAVGTAALADPLAPVRVLEELEAILAAKGLAAAQLVGRAHGRTRGEEPA
ncbi:dihydroorotate oxidase B, catalytic subunit [Thermaerobacter marianensis DSM 12885]|uniref:Dihydroorotate dehydrogenase n=1 Tax=Thermaerobacter marianensis (strain ATCC 700841 / DSM 12885 / JCM 10246 / 7p75a) TaxID=644966 RepID=E6SJH3_THEM7|nr:dihydroorotate dehydrogenase [Thermaerobacter marianensis]ADU52128.1 dihydroorotate oxidase B, catalytic subunit [Thermaerobacter marianensis DSM 12885]